MQVRGASVEYPGSRAARDAVALGVDARDGRVVESLRETLGRRTGKRQLHELLGAMSGVAAEREPQRPAAVAPAFDLPAELNELLHESALRLYADAQAERPADPPTFIRLTPNRSQDLFERYRRIHCIHFDIAPGGGPATDIAHKLGKRPVFVHLEGRRVELRKDKWQGSIATLDESPLGRPVGLERIPIICLHQLVNTLARHMRDAVGPHRELAGRTQHALHLRVERR